MALRLYSTLSRRLEELPATEEPVRIYACGMTVQDTPHLGHMRAYVTVDILRRFLEYQGRTVRLVQNFTDVDDKIIARAEAEGIDYRILAERFIADYFAAAARLHIKPADVYPRATQHIAEIIDLVARLIDRGAAYVADGDVYFAVERFPRYGTLSGKKIDDLVAGARVVPSAKKHNPLDFALWKAAKPGEPWWLSPWGRGRPGWHIECSAMAMRYLGATIDVHCGGEDLIFPHHENEVAQSESATGQPFARVWLHNGLLNLTGEKMAKSTGHYRRAGELLDRFSGNALRLFFLQAHYRSPLEFDTALVASAEAACDRISSFLDRAAELVDREAVPAPVDATRFTAALEDDLNTPQAIGLVFDQVREGFAALERPDRSAVAVIDAALRSYLAALGFAFETSVAGPGTRDLVELLVRTRTALRTRGDFASADEIRDGLARLGITLEDTPAGTRPRFGRP